MAGKIEVTQKMGDLTVRVEGETPQEIFKNLSFWSSLPKECGVCGAPLVLTHRSPKGNDYYHVQCTSVPAHEAQVRQHKTDKGGGLYFAKDEKFHDLWQGRDEEDESGAAPTQQQAAPARDSFNARESSAPRQNGAQSQTASGNGGGPTSGQRTLLQKVLEAKGLSVADAEIALGAEKRFDKMSVPEAVKFIDAAKAL
jgi:hypothetical protein